MALDESTIRRIMREEREQARKEEADAAERKALNERIAELERKSSAKPEKKEEDAGEDHEFVI